MTASPGHLIGPAAREQLRIGFNQLADAMTVALGPRGRTVAVDRHARKAPELITDGSTLARRVYALPSRARSMGLLMARHLATRVEDAVGDGSSTAVLLARGLIDEGCKLIAAGAEPMLLRQGLEALLPDVLDALRAQARPLNLETQTLPLARAITGNDALARHINDCFDVVGENGAIEVRPSNGVEHEREYIQGALWNKGWESQHFAKAGESVLDAPRILFTTHRLNDADALVPLLQRIVAEPDGKARGLAVIAFNIEGAALNLLVTNHSNGALPAVAVNAPGAGDERFDILQDLAILCGGRLISEEAGDALENVQLGDLGSADQVRVIRSAFTIVAGKGRPAAIRARAQDLRKQLAIIKDTTQRDRVQERAGKLAGGVALLRVGGASDTEREWLKARADEAVRVIRLAGREGVLPGGGWALANVAPLTSEAHPWAARALRKALQQPARAILRNSGIDADALPKRPSRQHVCDVNTGKWVNAFNAQIVDPVAVTIEGVRAAVSTAAMLLTVEALIHKPRNDRDDDVKLEA